MKTDFKSTFDAGPLDQQSGVYNLPKASHMGGGIIIAKNQKGGRMNRNVQKIKENVKKGGRFFRKGGGITSSSRENIDPCSNKFQI